MPKSDGRRPSQAVKKLARKMRFCGHDERTHLSAKTHTGRGRRTSRPPDRQMLLKTTVMSLTRPKAGQAWPCLARQVRHGFHRYFMPDMKGDQLAAAIKRRSPKQAVVMLTAFPEKFQSSACPWVALIPSSANLSNPYPAVAIARFAPVKTWSPPSNNWLLPPSVAGYCGGRRASAPGSLGS